MDTRLLNILEEEIAKEKENSGIKKREKVSLLFWLGQRQADRRKDRKTD